MDTWFDLHRQVSPEPVIKDQYEYIGVVLKWPFVFKTCGGYSRSHRLKLDEHFHGGTWCHPSQFDISCWILYFAQPINNPNLVDGRDWGMWSTSTYIMEIPFRKELTLRNSFLSFKYSSNLKKLFWSSSFYMLNYVRKPLYDYNEGNAVTCSHINSARTNVFFMAYTI